jgi:two-component system OmpR family response regulator
MGNSTRASSADAGSTESARSAASAKSSAPSTPSAPAKVTAATKSSTAKPRVASEAAASAAASTAPHTPAPRTPAKRPSPAKRTSPAASRSAANDATARLAVVIEDDDDIRQLLQTVLGQAGFHVLASSNGLDGIEMVRATSPLVTVLDLNMPGIDGFETLRRLREFSETYIVMLTALGDEAETFDGLEPFVDEYLTKPFRPRDLRTRIEAMLDRPRAVVPDPVEAAHAFAVAAEQASIVEAESITSRQKQWEFVEVTIPLALKRQFLEADHAVRKTQNSTLLMDHDRADGWHEHNGLWVNLDTRAVHQDGLELELTNSEFEVLAALLISQRRVRSTAELVLLLRGNAAGVSRYVSDSDAQAIDVIMSHLSRRLADNADAPRWVEKVRSEGYRLAAARTY